ncbi:MAG: hypothetical protein LUE98_04850 [Tannerellaceae bacterium]|nr:hypothetical protein [Tannerellaceae bacterium]
MIIKGTLTYDNQTTKTRYWRLNLAADYGYKLFRNVEYTVILSKITTKGYNTPEEAEEDEDGGEVIPKDGASVMATININDWRTIGLDQGV